MVDASTAFVALNLLAIGTPARTVAGVCATSESSVKRIQRHAAHATSDRYLASLTSNRQHGACNIRPLLEDSLAFCTNKSLPFYAGGPVHH